MDAAQINQTFDLVSLASQDTNLRQEGMYYRGPCPFCGGTDRFVVKTTPTGYRWFCRNCGGGKYHTAIDYIMRRDNLDFQTALKNMGGEKIGLYERKSAREPAKKLIPVLPTSEWQDDGWREVDKASDCLLTGKARPGQEYLLKRGLHSGTWEAWHLGVSHIYDGRLNRSRPAIVIPWLDFDPGRDVLTAIKYRFIFDEPDRPRYSSRSGSVPILYGLWDTLPTHQTLLLVEGEINALSVWQCLPSGVTCLSIGSQTGGRPDILQTLSKQYENIVVWTDDSKRAGEIRDIFRQPTTALCSPKINAQKWDANRMLVEGVLKDFLSRKLRVPCLGK